MNHTKKTVIGGVALAASAVALNAWAAPVGGSIDLAKGDIQATDASCGDFRLANLKPGKSYMLWVKGERAATCRFLANGLTFHYPPSHGPTLPGSTTAYSFTRIGDDVLVSWVRGY